MSPNKLSDTQLVLLSAASQREDGAIDPGEGPKGGLAKKAIGKLLTDGLVEEVPADGLLPAWRRDDRGPLALCITARGLAAIGIDNAGASCPLSPRAFFGVSFLHREARGRKKSGASHKDSLAFFSIASPSVHSVQRPENINNLYPVVTSRRESKRANTHRDWSHLALRKPATSRPVDGRYGGHRFSRCYA